jgi:hypothetical protein
MSEAKDGLQIVSASVGGWCDPVTKECYSGTDDGAATVEADNENTEGDVPDAAE